MSILLQRMNFSMKMVILIRKLLEKRNYIELIRCPVANEKVVKIQSTVDVT